MYRRCEGDRGSSASKSAGDVPVVEYLRAFLAARAALSWLNGLLIISGAFGIFSLFGMLENFGYRQIATWWPARGATDYFRNKQGGVS